MNNATDPYLVLAAGFSQRFGSAKLLHTLPSGNTVIGQTIEALKASGCEFVIVVRGDDEAMLAYLSKYPLKLIKVKNADKGLASVIAEVCRQLSSQDINWLGICLADMPYIKPDTFKNLSNHAANNTIIRPRYLMQPGHPVLFGRDFFDELKKLEGDDGAKSVIQRHKNALKSIDVTDPMVVYDIDEPSDIIQTK